ncbi:MAG TPA: bifunctional demethylmenaquinone methyltransferase/2-methoxy-6-polyprenyl-1,4-benzoquinol methylase UbiE [Thermoanaerobaculia bacterium]|nr:bifunctional demethylmenaquinone methyltransferase/2-methoxy-6-polyprenyl-1,4-benzoquinol methylase UbiE [Thermoanaerobaculia bacterium]
MARTDPDSLAARSTGPRPQPPGGAGARAEPRADGSGRMFDAIARRYDRLNRVLSLGADRRWRRRAVAALELADGDRVLDVATGTADLALEIARARPGVEVIGVDPSLGMLEVGRRKVAAAALEGRVRLEEADGQALPFAVDSFDAACIAFGIRNVPDRRLGLAEMARVVRPGGRVVVLELSEPRRGLLALGARFYIRVLVPRIGALLSGAAEYRYLQSSIAAFPPPAELAALMESCGIAAPRVRPLTFGVAHLFAGVVGGPATGAGAEGRR